MLHAHVRGKGAHQLSEALCVEDVVSQVQVFDAPALTQAITQLEQRVAVDTSVDQMEALQAGELLDDESESLGALLGYSHLIQIQLFDTLTFLFAERCADVHELLGAQPALDHLDGRQRSIALDRVTQQPNFDVVHLILEEFDPLDRAVSGTQLHDELLETVLGRLVLAKDDRFISLSRQFELFTTELEHGNISFVHLVLHFGGRSNLTIELLVQIINLFTVKLLFIFFVLA